jgi:choline kinase
MRAIILAAGRGSRMGDLTNEKPKCLVELGGRSLLEKQIDALRAAGISEIGIVTGYKREMLANRGLVEFHNARWAETNMVSSLACAHVWLQKEPCVVSYSDIFYEASAVKSLMISSAPIAITYDLNWFKLWTQRFGDPLLDAETFRITPEGTLLEIGNKPLTTNEVQGQFMGLLRFTPTGWAEISHIRAELDSAEADKMHMTGALQKVIDLSRLPITAIPYDAEWGEIDSPRDLKCSLKISEDITPS